MNTHIQIQKGSTVAWMTAAALVIVIGLILVLSSGTRPIDCCHGEQYQVTIMVPADLTAYKTAEIAHVQVGGPDPIATTKFIATTTTPNTDVADPIWRAAEAAAEYIPTQAGTSSLVAYLKVVDGTAYVLLTMDMDGWAGVSSAIAQVHPIVEKTLLQFPDIKSVKFEPAPGDSIDQIMTGESKSENFYKSSVITK